jgi:glycerol-3-phosphate acyltransferase PlsY
LGGIAAAAGAGYLLGSIPIGVIMGRLAAGVDVRKYGSRVSGATNVLRAAGPVAAGATLGLDTAKGYLAVKLVEQLGTGDEGAVAAAVGAAVGHSWPLFADFKGGRSVGTCWGSLMAFDGTAATTAGVAGSLTIATTRYVSAGALTGATAAAIATLLRSRGPSRRATSFSLFTLVFLSLRLQDNIERLRRGQERRLGDQINLARDGAPPQPES